jgi:hypothetical protein
LKKFPLYPTYDEDWFDLLLRMDGVMMQGVHQTALKVVTHGVL